MNPIQQFIKQSGMDEVEAMNHLQQIGCISDHCVNAPDVADEDCRMAVYRLEKLVANIQ